MSRIVARRHREGDHCFLLSVRRRFASHDQSLILGPRAHRLSTHSVWNANSLNMLCTCTADESRCKAGRQSHDFISVVAGCQEEIETDERHGRNNTSLFRRSFPIRISQISRHAAQPVAHHMPLRRKTLSGTVDAGYDGSHILTPPWPPMKHVIIRTQSNFK